MAGNGVGEEHAPRAVEDLQAQAADEEKAQAAAERLVPGADLAIQRVSRPVGHAEQLAAHVTVPADTATLAESLAMSVFGESLPWIQFSRLSATELEPDPPEPES